MSLVDLPEGIILHIFEGKLPFGHESLERIAELRKIYGLDLDASASHRFERPFPAASRLKARTSDCQY